MNKRKDKEKEVINELKKTVSKILTLNKSVIAVSLITHVAQDKEIRNYGITIQRRNRA